MRIRKTQFVGVREFKEGVVKYVNGGAEIVILKRKKPIARLTPVPREGPEAILLEIGRILNEAGISREDALNALERSRRKLSG